MSEPTLEGVDEIMYFWDKRHKNTAEIAKLLGRTEAVVDRVVHAVLNERRRLAYISKHG